MRRNLGFLANPQICTPGQSGSSVITATAQGVTSPSTVIYVHQHIDHIVVSPVAAQPPPLSSTCFSAGQTPAQTKGEVYNFQANAFSGNGTDITASVGIFEWQATNAQVVTLKEASLSTPITGLLPGQVPGDGERSGHDDDLRDSGHHQQRTLHLHDLSGGIDIHGN